ncbi:MAG: hypothetical protein UU94_C0005G0040, partial [Candidatus Collierbacteria bacterium GW2011_GWB2_42_12]
QGREAAKAILAEKPEMIEKIKKEVVAKVNAGATITK